ncbi:MAG: DUF3365 domain-containing protein [Cytophagaceae bacterium]
MKKLFFILLFLAALTSCDEKPDTTGVSEEIRNRKIRKISDADILSGAEVKGLKIVLFSQKKITMNVENAFNREGLAKAMEYCSLKNNPWIDSLEKAEFVKLRRVSLHPRNPENLPDSTERVLLEAYEYNVKNKISRNSHTPEIGDRTILFTAPILIENSCLKCHGIKGKDIKDTDYKLIQEKYPQDQAANYRLEELVGMWSVVIDKKEFIRRMK